MKSKQSGFTLIEIAIVLVIIGLLLGGVLKGQELINSAKVKSLATDFRNIPVYIYGYQDKFRAIPGDDKMSSSHLGVASAVANPGDGDGLIDSNWNSGAGEAHHFWQHVRLAGLAPGPTDPAAGDYIPINSVAGEIGIQSGTSTIDDATFGAPIKDTQATAVAIRGTYVICSKNILGKFAKQLDIQLDDGNTGTGAMLAGPDEASGTTITADSSLEDSEVYTVCMGV